MHWKGAHDPNRLYRRGNEVMDGGVFYVCILDTSASFPASAPGDDSTHWSPLASGASVQPFVAPPPVSEWTWASQDLATAEDVPGGIKITAPRSEANPYVVLIGGDLPSAPYTITAAFNTAINTGDQYAIGLTLFDPDSGKLKIYTIYYSARFGLFGGAFESVVYYNDFVTSGDSPSIDATTSIPYTPVIWFKLNDDGSNVNFSLSYEGVTYCLFSSVPNSEFISTASQHGLVLAETYDVSPLYGEYDTLLPLVTTLLSYEVTTP